MTLNHFSVYLAARSPGTAYLSGIQPHRALSEFQSEEITLWTNMTMSHVAVSFMNVLLQQIDSKTGFAVGLSLLFCPYRYVIDI